MTVLCPVEIFSPIKPINMKTKSKRLWMTTIVAFLALVVLIGGCKKDEYVEIVGVCPVVESTNPTNGATNVPLNQIVTATFNEEMNPVTITQSSFTLTGGLKSGVPVAGILSYNNTNATLSFVPSAPLAQNTTYTGTVKSTIKDMQGNALQTNYVWTFSTGIILSPTVISTDPANNATGVFINKVITASFSVPMDSLTINAATYTLKQGTTAIAGTVTYSGITASFTPNSELAQNSPNETKTPNKANDDDYLSVKELFYSKLQDIVLDDKKEKRRKLNFVDLASATVRGLAKLTGVKMRVTSKVDENGNVEAIAFQSKTFSISRGTK